MEYKIFYSWQNQNKETRKFIDNQLKKTKSYMKNEYNIKINIIDSPTKEEAGSPDICEKILEQIMTCDVFIGDLTPIIKQDDSNKLISNPNVMYETGIAISTIGESRIILLMENDNKNNKVDDLCFDINHNRISPISIKNENFYKSLSEWIKTSIEHLTAQKFIDDFVVKDLINDIVVVYNNFFRMIYTYTEYYPMNFNNLSKDDISHKLSFQYLNIFQVRRDYSAMIRRISRAIKELTNNSRYRKLVYELVLFCNALNDYNNLNLKSKYKFFEEVEVNNQLTYILGSNEQFYIKKTTNYSDIKDSHFFREDTYLLSIIDKESSYCFIDIFLKDSIDKTIKSLEQAYINRDGKLYAEQENIYYKNLPLYIININNIDKYSEIIYKIIYHINNILDILKINPTDIIHGKSTQGYLISFVNQPN